MFAAESMWAYYKHKLQGKENVKLRNSIVTSNEGLLHRVADRYRYRCRESKDELAQIGAAGLIRAVERFDPTSGNSFSSYAVPLIVSEVMHYLRDHGSNVKIPRRWREEYSKVSKVEEAWMKSRGKLPTEQQIVTELNMSVVRLRQVREAIANQMADSFEEDPDDFAAIGNVEEVVEFEEPDLRKFWQSIQANIKQLPSTDRQILEAIYCERKSRKEVALQFGLSSEGVKNKIQNILNCLAGKVLIAS